MKSIGLLIKDDGKEFDKIIDDAFEDADPGSLLGY